MVDTGDPPMLHRCERSEPAVAHGLPFVARPMTDRAGATSAAHAAAEHWGLGEVRIMRIGMNIVFAHRDGVLRVGHPTANPQLSYHLAETLRAHGVRVPRPRRHTFHRVGDVVVTDWERLLPIDRPIDWVTVGEMVARVHALSPAQVPDGYPLPSPVGFPWWQLETHLAAVESRLDPRARAGLRRCIERHRNWRDLALVDPVVCHGDVHPGNVMQTASGPVLLDWDLLCCAPAGWDHAPLLTWASRWGGEPAVYAEFARGYGASLRSDAFAGSVAELRLVAATLLLVQRAEHDDGVAQELANRMRYWQGDRDPPMWQSQ